MKKQLSPYLIILLSFIALIIIGTILLVLPFSSVSGEKISFIDALYLSASSVTISGITTIENIHNVLSVFGKVVITVLVKIGGLSVITISVFIMYLLGAKIGITNRYLLKENLNTPSLKGVVKLVKAIIFFSFSIELIGTIINMFVFTKFMSFGSALGVSIVQSIISFNNAGSDLFGINHLLFENTYPLFTISSLVLVIIGGIGFVVIFDIISHRSYKKLSLHSKIVLKVNLVLWIFGFLMFKINSNYSFFESIFLSINARSAGFGFNLNIMPNHATLVLLILMLIGTSPSSTGSGIKTTTIYVLYKSLISFARGKETTTSKRLISDDTKYRAFILLIFIVFVILIFTTAILIIEPISIEVALHEVIANISNAGITTGYNYLYSSFTKVLMILLMFVGRVGILTILAVFNINWSKPVKSNISYIEENIIIG